MHPSALTAVLAYVRSCILGSLLLQSLFCFDRQASDRFHSCVIEDRTVFNVSWPLPLQRLQQPGSLSFFAFDFDSLTFRGIAVTDSMGNIQDIAPAIIASWPKPNYVDPERRTWYPAFALVWQVASTLLVWGRFWLRVRHLAGPFGYDDAFMLIAWVSTNTREHATYNH